MDLGRLYEESGRFETQGFLLGLLPETTTKAVARPTKVKNIVPGSGTDVNPIVVRNPTLSALFPIATL